MATTFQYQLTRYSKTRAERQLSQIEHLQADSFGLAHLTLESMMRGATHADPSWEYAIASLAGVGYHGRTAQATDMTFWPADPVAKPEKEGAK